MKKPTLIRIVSGEGEGPGHVETYTGALTPRAIKARLTRERCHGDRWARAEVYSHSNDFGHVYIDYETKKPHLVIE